MLIELTERINSAKLHYLNTWTFKDFKQNAKTDRKTDENVRLTKTSFPDLGARSFLVSICFKLSLN